MTISRLMLAAYYSPFYMEQVAFSFRLNAAQTLSCFLSVSVCTLWKVLNIPVTVRVETMASVTVLWFIVLSFHRSCGKLVDYGELVSKADCALPSVRAILT
jgi:hypothetical protein